MTKQMYIKFVRGSLYINSELFILVSGLNDDRNSKKKVREYINSHGCWRDDFIYYQEAVSLALRMMETGDFWMYSDIVDVYECGLYRRILDFIDQCHFSGTYPVSIL